MRRTIPSPACAVVLVLAAALISIHYEAAAQRGARGGSAAVSRGASGSASVSRGAYGGTANVQRSSSYSASASATRSSVSGNAQVNRNVNVSRDVNVDVDDHHDYHPGAGLAVAATAAAVTAAAVGTVAYSIPPSCVPVVVNGVTYQQCGSTWYQPQYAGTSVTYVVTNPPG